MSRLGQYFLLGGMLVVFQTKAVRQIFQSSSFLYTALGAIVLLWIGAAVVSVSAQKRKKRQEERQDDKSLW